MGLAMARRRNKSEERDIAAARIATLLGQAETELAGPDADLADRYASLAVAIGQRYQMPLGPAARARVCRRCHGFRSAASMRVRLRRGRLVTTCVRCGDIRRRGLEVRHA